MVNGLLVLSLFRLSFEVPFSFEMHVFDSPYSFPTVRCLEIQSMSQSFARLLDYQRQFPECISNCWPPTVNLTTLVSTWSIILESLNSSAEVFDIFLLLSLIFESNWRWKIVPRERIEKYTSCIENFYIFEKYLFIPYLTVSYFLRRSNILSYLLDFSWTVR